MYMEWFKRIWKCRFKKIHKVSIISGECVRCGKVVRSSGEYEFDTVYSCSIVNIETPRS